jgi:hypothetical protein
VSGAWLATEREPLRRHEVTIQRGSGVLRSLAACVGTTGAWSPQLISGSEYGAREQMDSVTGCGEGPELRQRIVKVFSHANERSSRIASPIMYALALGSYPFVRLANRTDAR